MRYSIMTSNYFRAMTPGVLREDAVSIAIETFSPRFIVIKLFCLQISVVSQSVFARKTFYSSQTHVAMEQCASKILSNWLNINIYSYLETSGGQSLYQYLNVVQFFNTSVDYTSVAS